MKHAKTILCKSTCTSLSEKISLSEQISVSEKSQVVCFPPPALLAYVGLLFSMQQRVEAYGVALVSRIDTIIGLFCKRALQKRLYSAKESPIILSILLTVATPYL